MTSQQIFSPTDYNFDWDGDWYKWDAKSGRSAALKARNAQARKLAKLGYTVKKFSMRDQRISKGGIGSGHPHVEFWVTVYGFNAFK